MNPREARKVAEGSKMADLKRRYDAENPAEARKATVRPNRTVFAN
jgi:hypothetical protein